MLAGPDQRLRIVHIVRSPVGGAFRHLVDLARGQAARGHRVGVICDSGTGGERASATLAGLAPELALGVTRFPIPREPSPLDPIALIRTARRLRALAPDVVHGHGAKGGAVARMSPAGPNAMRVYTPHGGSLHYGPATLAGRIYGVLERGLMKRTDLFLFESAFARDRFISIIGQPRATVRVVHNGVTEDEFEPVAPAPQQATDLVFLGELRRIKGPDLLIDALDRLARDGRRLSLTIAGEGGDGAALQDQAAALGLSPMIRFAGFRPARTAFAMGRVLVVPSRADSLPYVVIEAAAAGIPMIAARIGGIPEIFGPEAGRLVPPDDAGALASAIAAAFDDLPALEAATARLRAYVREHFSQDAMVEGVLAAYGEARKIPAIRSGH